MRQVSSAAPYRQPRESRFEPRATRAGLFRDSGSVRECRAQLKRDMRFEPRATRENCDIITETPFPRCESSFTCFPRLFIYFTLQNTYEVFILHNIYNFTLFIRWYLGETAKKWGWGTRTHRDHTKKWRGDFLLFLFRSCRMDVVIGLPAAVDLVCGWVDVLKTELFLV